MESLDGLDKPQTTCSRSFTPPVSATRNSDLESSSSKFELQQNTRDHRRLPHSRTITRAQRSELQTHYVTSIMKQSTPVLLPLTNGTAQQGAPDRLDVPLGAMSNAIAQAWIGATYEHHSGGKVLCKDLFDSIFGFCNQSGISAKNIGVVGMAIRACFPTIKKKRLRLKGSPRYYYCGIRPRITGQDHNASPNVYQANNLPEIALQPPSSALAVGTQARSPSSKPAAPCSASASPHFPEPPLEDATRGTGPLELDSSSLEHATFLSGRSSLPTLSIRLSSDDFDAVSISHPNTPVAGGGFSDLFVGRHVPTGMKLAMKRLRIKSDHPKDIDDAKRRFHREARHWSTYDDPNILPFFGILEVRHRIYLISPWMEQGSLSRLLRARKRPLAQEEEVDGGDLSWFSETRMIREVASGTAYLHTLGFVHGDLKCDNILIAEDGRALLCDFGLTKALGEKGTSCAMKGAGSFRFQSPELFDNEPKTLKSDVYAFSMVIVEILTKDYPLPGLPEGAFIKAVICQNERPPFIPSHRQGFDFNPLWIVASRCWQALPHDRPSMDDILGQLLCIEALDVVVTRNQLPNLPIPSPVPSALPPAVLSY